MKAWDGRSGEEEALIAAYFAARVRDGVTNVTTDGSGTAITNIGLGGAMVGTPVVTAVVSSGSSAGATVRCDSFTTTTFRVLVVGAAVSTSVPIAWQATVA